MAMSEARKRANEKYLGGQDEIKLRMPKGKKKLIQDYVKTFNPRISVNEYINKLIDNDMNEAGA
jgi:hypothetical protein